ncbi:ATP-binding cassette domain-containing protein, partial [uncultured Cloacibacillus sp.]
MMSFLTVDSVLKSYDIEGRRIEALRGVSLEIGENEFVTVVGRSGSGKTTLLRILASLEQPTAGVVRFRGRECSEENPLPAGMVFQEARLMPWLSALDNIIFACPPRERGEELRRAALRMIETV